MTIAISKPDARELIAIRRLAETHDGQMVLAFLERNAGAYMLQSMNPDSEAKTRQAQGAWMALTSFTTLAKAP